MRYVTSIERNARREGLILAIAVGLRKKFGNDGLQLLPEILTLWMSNFWRRLLAAYGR